MINKYKSSDQEILEAMRKYGGGFVRKLAELYWVADSDNREKLEMAFEKYFWQYDNMTEHSNG